MMEWERTEEGRRGGKVHEEEWRGRWIGEEQKVSLRV